MEIEKIASEFLINGKIENIQKITNGLINKTYLVSTSMKSYILQNINTQIFKNPDAIIYNHLYINSLLNKGDYQLKIVEPIKTQQGNYLLTNTDEVWRMSDCIENSKTHVQVNSTELAFEAVQALSHFYSVINSDENNSLEEILPDFLNFEKRVLDFNVSLENTSEKRLQNAKKEIVFLLENIHLPKKWISLHEENKIPKRIIHADPKISNLLFDENNKAIAVIDLDTVMTGSLLYDFGDMIRSYTNTTKEDDVNIVNNFSPEIYAAVKKGFLQHLENILSKHELENLDMAAQTVIYIQAVRFLTDYLNNDLYYSVQYEGQNLDRTKNQINLLKGVMSL